VSRRSRDQGVTWFYCSSNATVSQLLPRF